MRKLRFNWILLKTDISGFRWYKCVFEIVRSEILHVILTMFANIINLQVIWLFSWPKYTTDHLGILLLRFHGYGEGRTFHLEWMRSKLYLKTNKHLKSINVTKLSFLLRHYRNILSQSVILIHCTREIHLQFRQT